MSLLLLFLFNVFINVRTHGNTEIRIQSGISVYVRVHFCTYSTRCSSPLWKNIIPFEVIPEFPFVFEEYFTRPTLPNVIFTISIYDINDEEPLGLEQIVVPLTRHFSNFTVHTKNDSFLHFAVRNVCDENWRTHSCSIFCKDRSDSKFKCDDDDGYKCAPGYSGPNCDKVDCPFNCHNHGSCEVPGKCMCSQGFFGTYCEYCKPSTTCKHGAVLVNELGCHPYTCRCFEGYAGDNGDKDDVCYYAKPCRHGNCVSNVTVSGGFECICPKAFGGRRCEKRIARWDCSDEGYCQNKGVCSFVDGISRCRCAVGFTGKHCERKTAKTCLKKKCREGFICIIDNKKTGTMPCFNYSKTSSPSGSHARRTFSTS
ncbi:Delta-like protein [Caenorhabditis elegans]|uniref:Delta-like protein n=1 Tax=Caenorhabditis elegans TaxID=6239 RepID=Q93519_CAEEL|nr:Delta-like protein [Caenorhabditis elegans]CAB02963.3 Delta-like protein [Caenorhabditis elegans]